MTNPPAHIAAAMKTDAAAPPSEASLERVRAQLRLSRDKSREKEDLEARLKTVNEEINTISQKTLPDLFVEVGIDKLGLPAEGNLPAYDAALVPYYHANISADWPPEKQEEAFAYLAKEPGGEDMIKTVITIALGRGDRKTAAKVEKALDKLKVPYNRTLGVPWNTLTAWVREQVEKHKHTPSLDLLGATVGRVVKLKPRKQEQ